MVSHYKADTGRIAYSRQKYRRGKKRMTAERGSTPVSGISLCPSQYQLPTFPNLVSSDYRGRFSWSLERLGRKADHSPPFSAEAENV